MTAFRITPINVTMDGAGVRFAPVPTTTVGGVSGVRIADMPDLGAFDAGSSVVGEKAGSGRFSATSLSGYFLPLSGGGAVTNSTTSFSRTDTAPSIVPVLQVNYTGGGSSYGALSVNATNTDGSGVMWGIGTILNLTQTGTGQPVGIASTIFRTAGDSPAFCLYGQFMDRSGTNNAPAVNTQLDIRVCGPESSVTSYNPSFGGRCGIFMTLGAPDFHIAWAANTAFAANVGINPPGAPLYTYVSQNAGTSGATEPVWPTSAGTVVDGTITWAFGTTLKPQVARAIEVTGVADAAKIAQLGTAIYITKLPIYDAIIDMCNAMTFALDQTGALVNPNVAAIRMAQDWPIDFSGTPNAVGQNNRTLKYNSTTHSLEYQTLGHLGFSVHDDGAVAIAGSPADPGHQLEVVGSNTVGVSTSNGTFTTGVRVGADQRIGLDGSDAHYLQFRAATNRLYFVVGGVDKWSVDSNGNIRAAGTVTGSTTP